MNRFGLLICLFFFVLFIQVFQSCVCQRIDCDPGTMTVGFFSQADSSDLFENGTYQRDSLRLFVIHPSVTDDYSHWLYNWQNEPTFEQLPLSLHIDQEASGYIFQYNSLERDTLKIAYTVSDGSHCCNGAPDVTYGLFKGDTIFPNRYGYLIMKK